MFTVDAIAQDGTAATQTPQPEQRQELLLRPSLFVGNGGTGHLILLYLKALFQMFHGHIPRGVEIVAFDTAQENLSVSVGEEPTMLEQGTEFHYIGQVPVSGIARHIDNMPSIQERLPQIANLPAVNLHSGTGQIRPFGLLALLWHIDRVQKALEQPLFELANRENLGIVDGIHIDITQGLNVFQVGSLCGGTNSGQFLDIAYLIRDQLEQLGDLAQISDLIGVGVLPSAFRNVQGHRLLPNTVAALQELDRCMMQNSFRAEYRNGHVVETTHPPFNIYYLLGAVDENSRVQLSLNELCWMAAIGLYHLAMTPLGNRQQSIFANISDVLGNQTPDGHGTFFASFGFAELRFPAEDVVAWCSHRHARSIIGEGLLNPPQQDRLEAAVETTARTHELTPEGLLNDLSVDDAGIPLGVTFRLPARIRNAEPHAKPELAMTYVQTYRRERIDGDYRIWIRENAKRRQEKLLAYLTEQFQTALNDGALGLPFADAYAQYIGDHLADLSAKLTVRRQAQQARRAESEMEVDSALTDLMAAPEANWLFRGQVVQEALDRYLKAAREFLEVHIEVTALERAIALVVAAQEEVSAWARKIETLMGRLGTIDGDLKRRSRDLSSQLLAPAKSSGLALVNEAYLRELYQAYVPTPASTINRILEEDPQALQHWMEQSRSDVEVALLQAAERPFGHLHRMSVEEIITARSEHISPEQWLDFLTQKARPAWNLNEVMLPAGAANLARLELIGVPKRERSSYANKDARLVSTLDPHRITTFAMTAGAPFTALRSYSSYLRAYQEMGARRALLHTLPDFVADGDSTKLAFALGHLFGFIDDHGVYFYYQPIDELADQVKLGRGRENAFDTLGNQEGLVREVMQRVEARIEDIGYDRAQEKIAAFCKPTPKDDNLTRELKRIVRNYSEELEERRLI